MVPSLRSVMRAPPVGDGGVNPVWERFQTESLGNASDSRQAAGYVSGAAGIPFAPTFALIAGAAARVTVGGGSR